MQTSLSRKLILQGAIYTIVIVITCVLVLLNIIASRTTTSKLTSVTISRASDISALQNNLSNVVIEIAFYARLGDSEHRDDARASLQRAHALLVKLDGYEIDAAQQEERKQLSAQAAALLSEIETAAEQTISAVEGGNSNAITVAMQSFENSQQDLDSYIANSQHLLEADVDRVNSILDTAPRQSLVGAVIGFALLFLLTMFAIYRLQKGIVQSINELARAATKVAAGQPTQLLHKTSADEIGRLQEAFNVMLTEITSKRQTLEQTNRELRQNLAYREQTQARLKMLASIVETSRDAIISYTSDGTILSWNHGAETLYGYSAAEAIGQNGSIVVAPEHYEQQAILRARILNGEAMDWETTRRSKDGRSIDMWLTAWPTYNKEGHVIAMSSIGRDISERRKVDRLKNEFISTVSHELRTPLTSIRGALGLVVGGVAGEVAAPAKAMLDIAYSNSERLVRLINDILDIEKIEAGKMEFNLRPIALGELVERALQSNAAFAGEYGVSFVLRDEAPGVQVRADADRLDQVLANLLSNAAKFAPPGSSVQVTLAGQDGLVRVTVADQGAGISDEFRGRIFQKFAQADASNTRQKGGTGLGLSIVKAIIEQLGGTVGFTAHPGAATTFFFDLPEWRDPANVPAIQPAAAPARVLICEDDPDIVALLRLILEHAGFACDSAANADEAKIMLAGHTYSAMTLDLVLPGEDGIELIRELRELEATRGLPIVVVSAVAASGRLQFDGNAVSVIDWLDKPIDQQRLVAAVRAAALGKAASDKTVRILHVEDDPDMRQVVATMLREVALLQPAASLAEARRALRERHFDLLILDMNLPDGLGLDLIADLQGQHGTAVPVVLFSVQEIGADIAQHVAAVLVKTRTSDEMFVRTITDLVAGKAAPLAAGRPEPATTSGGR